MDHLLLPKDPAFPTGGRPRVPYVCKAPYDGQGFLTYPRRAGKPTVIPSADAAPFAWHEANNPSDDKTDLEPFFQTWVFFGLLHELLAPFGMYNDADFVDTDGSGQYVHTRRLAVLFDTWTLKIKTLSDVQRETTRTNLMDCLDLAEMTMRCLIIYEQRPEAGHPNFDAQIRFSLACICETVAELGILTLGEDPRRDWQRAFSAMIRWDDNDYKHMVTNGWCPTIIHNVERDFVSVASKFYFRAMRRSAPLPSQDHEACTKTGCKHLSIQVDRYRPGHVCEDCDCGLLGPDPERVGECLEADTYPLLEIEGISKHDVSVDVVAFSDTMPQAYVALSHVWIDGMGNPKALALPRCQLLKISQLVRQIEGKLWTTVVGNNETTRREDRKLLIWCDSLLCPVELDKAGSEGDLPEEKHSQAAIDQSKRMKLAALKKMREVYENAAYVLVIDRDLQELTISALEPPEALARVLTSRWAQRLWTLQEGMLGRKLLIPFAEGPYDFRELWGHARTIHLSSLTNRVLGSNLAARCAAMRSYPPRDVERPSILLVLGMIARRSVTCLADEPLCAATVFGLDGGKVAAFDSLEDRMATLWTLLCESPSGILDNVVFNVYPRLSRPGFRWAPSSFRELSGQVTPFTSVFRGGKALLRANGIEIRRPCWRCAAGTAIDGIIQDIWIVSKLKNYLYARGPTGTWYTLSWSSRFISENATESIWAILTDPQAACCLLLLDFIPDSSLHSSALLGYSDSSCLDLLEIRTQAVIEVNFMAPLHGRVLDAAARHGDAIKSGMSPLRIMWLKESSRIVESVIHTLGYRQLPELLIKFPLLPLRRFAVIMTSIFTTPLYRTLPLLIEVWLGRLLARLFKRLFQASHQCLITEIRKIAALDFQLPEIRDAIVALHPMVTPASMFNYVYMQVVGQYVKIEEAWDETQKWFVD